MEPDHLDVGVVLLDRLDGLGQPSLGEDLLGVGVARPAVAALLLSGVVLVATSVLPQLLFGLLE